LDGRLICTVSVPKLFSLVLFDEIQVRAISDYEILSIYFDYLGDSRVVKSRSDTFSSPNIHTF